MPATESIAEAIREQLGHLERSGKVSAGPLSRAAELLGEQVEADNGDRPIKARIGSAGHRYTVRSKDRTYTVDPTDWSDNCPATRTCYHVLACWILSTVKPPKETKAAQVITERREPMVGCCDGCGEFTPRRKLTELDPDDPRFIGVPLAHFAGDMLCPACYEGAA